MAKQRGFATLLWSFGLFCIISNTDISAHAQTQIKRASRITSSRSFGTNVKQSASHGINFDCPEEFGYYPHPTDCTQYYVCVFGGALLESCTGGLMYSHELQTCDWPRNVGCEVVDSGSAATSAAGQRDVAGSAKIKQQQQQQQQHQHLSSRVRFGSAFTSSGAASAQQKPTVAPQYHRQPSQAIQAQVQTIPPPPALKVAPNPVITSRGQPKPLLDSQEDIAKLYADAHASLPPVEEEESDRQQRVYRGQPSTVSQVQRDRDGIIHQASINAIPNHGKIGSYTFGSQFSKHFVNLDLSSNRLDSSSDDEGTDFREPRRVRRDLDAHLDQTITETTEKIDAIETELGTETKENATTEIIPTTQTTTDATSPDINTTSLISIANSTIVADDSNNSKEITEATPAGSNETTENDSNTSRERFDYDYATEWEDSATAGSARAPRQLRPFLNQNSRWQSQVGIGSKYRSIDSNPYQQQQQPSYSFGAYNPYLTPPAHHNYNQLSPGYQHYQHPIPTTYNQKPKTVYTGYNLSLPPPAIQDDFRPIPANYYGPASTTTPRPRFQPDLLPFLLQSLREIKEKRKKLQSENFSYFHLENQPVTESAPPAPSVPVSTEQPAIQYYHSLQPKQPQKVTPNTHYSPFSTIGGFYNNHGETHYQHPFPSPSPTISSAAKLISQYSISEQYAPSSTTESNYFKYNILANQKMKGYYSTIRPFNYETTSKPFVTKTTTARPSTSHNFNIVSAPNLALERPTSLKQSHISQYSNFPVSVNHANSSSRPESFQTFTSIVSSTIPPKLKTSTLLQQATVKPKANLQFNIPEFVASLQPSEMANFSPTVLDMLKYFKQVGVDNKLIPIRHFTSSTTLKPFTENNYRTSEKDTTTERLRYRTKVPQSTTAFSSTSPKTLSTKRPVKGYESFIKSIPQQKTKFSSSTIKAKPSSTTASYNSEEYYDEYEEEPLGNDSDDDILPPSKMPPYMPLSETMAPPRPQILAPTTLATKPISSKPNYLTGYYEATTTRRPLFDANFQQFYHNGGAPISTTSQTQHKNNNHNQIPAFINFPTDFFQEIKQRLPQLHETSTHWSNLPMTSPTLVTRPTARIPTPITATSTTSTTTTTTSSTTTTTTPPRTTTLRSRYTVRPQRTRGNSKWQLSKITALKNHKQQQQPPQLLPIQLSPNESNQTDFSLHSFRKRPTTASSSPSSSALGALELNVNMNLDTDSHRVESSSPSPQAANQLFVQPPRPTNVIVEAIPSNRNQQNRNYYNTSSATASSHAGYQSQQQIPLQQQQQQQQIQQHQQAPPEQSSYESYYSVYDDDIDLYREIEYQQQHQPQQQQQQQQQQHQQQQYNPQQPLRQPLASQQSTYRPLEILTTPTPQVQQQQPQRETYRPLQQQKAQQPEKPTYNNQQSLIYNTDYDEDLIAQIEQDNAYDQPTRAPIRSELVTIQTLNDSPSSTARPALANDERNYYNTLTTESTLGLSESPSYGYKTAADDYTTVQEYYATRRPLTREKNTRNPTTYAPTTYLATQEADEYNTIIGATAFNRETTKSIDLTTNVVKSTTKFAKTTAASTTNRVGTTSSRQTTATSRKTTSGTIKNSTAKISTQIVKTTTPATTTKSISINLSKNDAETVEDLGKAPQTHSNNLTTTATSITSTTSATNPNSSSVRSAPIKPDVPNNIKPTESILLTLMANVDFSNRSKSHANKIFKNQQQPKSPQSPKQPPQLPPTSTLSPIPQAQPSPSADTKQQKPQQPQQPQFPRSSSHVSGVTKTKSHSAQVQSNESFQIYTQSSVEVGASSAQSIEDDVESISDESQNVHENSAETIRSRGGFEHSTPAASEKSRAWVAAEKVVEAYGKSSRSNLVPADADDKSSSDKSGDSTPSKSYRDFRSRPSANDFRTKSIESDGASVQFSEQQRKRLQGYVLSDVAPQSFKTANPPTVNLTQTRVQPSIELIDSAGSSSTTKRYPTSAAYEPKPFQYNLQTGTNGFSLKTQDYPSELEDTSKPIYERRPYTQIFTTSTTKHPTTARVLPPTTSPYTTAPAPPPAASLVEYQYEEDIVPTTYAPALRVWRIGRTSHKPFIRTEASNSRTGDHVSGSGSEHNLVISANQEYTYDSNATSTTTTEAPPTTTSTTTSTTTERPIQSYTARATVFKDNLSKTTGSPASRFVSPYKSLETILQEKDERSGFNFIRTTSKPRQSNPTAVLYSQTTNKPFRNYFIITTPGKNLSDAILSTVSSNLRNFSISDAILSNFSTITQSQTTSTTTPTTTRITTQPPQSSNPTTLSTVVVTSPVRIVQSAPISRLRLNAETARPRGRSRYTAATVSNLLDGDEPTTYAPKFRFPTSIYDSSTPSTSFPYRRKVQRVRPLSLPNQRNIANAVKSREKYRNYKPEQQVRDSYAPPSKSLNRKPIENESVVDENPRAEALVALPIDAKQDNSIESSKPDAEAISSTEQVVTITDRPHKYFFSNKYRQQTADRTLAESLHNAGYLTSSTGRTKYRPSTVLEQLQLFLAGNSGESSSQQYGDDFAELEIKAAVEEIKNLYNAPTTTTTTSTTTTTTTQPPPTTTTTTTLRPTTTAAPPTVAYTSTTLRLPNNTKTTLGNTRSPSTTPKYLPKFPTSTLSALPASPPTSSTPASTAQKPQLTPGRASRVNNAIKSSIAAAASSASAQLAQSATAARSNKVSGLPSLASNANAAAAAVKCSDTTSNAKCNEIPSRTNSNSNRNRGSSHFANQDRDTPAPVTSNRGTHPPRTRPTLKPSGTIVSKAQEFVDIYRNPPSRPDPLYPQPTPDKTAAKCRKDVCQLPDCSCGGRDIPGDLNVETVPQIVLLTFDDSVNDLNKQLYIDLFEKGRVNPNGCPITATFYVSHEWTDYSQVQNLYSDGHEMASHTVSHSFGEQFSQKKWTREIAGQREILAAYGGVKLSDVRGMRAPFLSVGGNKMFKMLYDSNFTYDSSMPVYENRPPSWPYTLDYKIFHDCMIPPCPTRSYPGVWQVPMVMWQDLNGGRCSMGDACSNPSESEGVTKMIMKNFERHYTTNRAPFGLFYHAAWFTQPHHKEGFIKFLDTINAMPDVWILTNWQALQWVRDPTPISRINSFQPFQCDFSDRPKRCNNPKVCNLWHKSGVRYMKTCQPCPDIYPWTGKTGIRSSRIDNEIEDSTA